ncbi:MAG TPA: hypothetical protein VM165_07650 [Planctomycetaceae bacterium]|nr:hypothetical protein [Planctomycetaceae bacterium]
MEDVALVPQGTTGVSVAFDDVAVAEFFEDQVDQGRRPEQFARIWMHTHPGDCPLPSRTDEETFARVFGGCDWAVMLILARGGATYARLEWHVGPQGALLMPVAVDYRRPFAGSDEAAWGAEYDECVVPLDPEVWCLGEHGPFLRRDGDARVAVAAGVSGPGGECGGRARSGRAADSRTGLDHPGTELGVQRRDLVPGGDESPDGGVLRPDAGGGRVPAVV